MEEILGKCGYRCDLCPAYKQNIKCANDKKRCSDGWSKYLGLEIPPEEIGCGGCLNEKELADPNCPVRPCVVKNNLENCGHCKNFGCDNLKTRMNFIEENVDLSSIPQEDSDVFIKPYQSKERLLKINKELNNSS